MTKARIQPWLEKEDYEEFRGLAPGDPALPATYDEWEEINLDQEMIFRKSGIKVERVYLDVADFSAYCTSCGLNPDGVARAAFAVQKHCPGKN